jgi:ubiquinone/menaquinone biosynthesis C-methylase UbiE
MTNKPEIDSEITQYLINEFSGVMSDTKLDIVIKVHLEEKEYDDLFQLLNHIITKELCKSWGTVLDLGCGLGELSRAFANNGINVIGLEPNKEALKISKHKERHQDVICGVGEYLPLRDCCLNSVYSISILEHVQDVKAVSQEMLRVLDINGVCLGYCPDYASAFYEEHYKIFWFPMLTKFKVLARFYVRLRERKINYINGINYVTRRKLRTYFNGQKFIDATVLFNKTGLKIRAQKISRRDNLMLHLNCLGRIWFIVHKEKELTTDKLR